MRKSIAVAILVGAWFGFTVVATAGDVKDVKKGKVEIYDDCDPTDEAWNETGGCTLEGGKVTEAEFGSLLFSPLGDGTVIGHPAWRMDRARDHPRATQARSLPQRARSGARPSTCRPT